MGNLPPFHRKNNPSTSASNESLSQSSSHIVDVPQKDRYSNSKSLRKFGPKKLHFNKDIFQAIFVHPNLYALVEYALLIVFLLVLCVGVVVLGLGILALAYSCILIVSLAILPLLLVSLLITRIFQFIKYGYDYKKLTRFKHFLRGWLYIDVIIVLVGLWIFYLIAKFVPSLKPVIVLDLHLTNWVVITTIVCVLYLISFVMYNLTHHLTQIGNFGSTKLPQAISEIIDGFILWLAKHLVMKRVPTFQEHEILGLPTRKWIRVSILVLIGYNLITIFTHLLVFSLRYVCNQISVDYNGGIWQKLFGKQLHTKFVVHFANEMRLSISFVMSSLLVLLTWVLYFGARLDMEVSITKSVWELGKWTFTSLFIYSFLCLVKSFILLAWEVKTVYLRLEPKIKSTSEELYFLGNLGSDKHDFFKVRPRHPDQSVERQQSGFAKWLARVSTCSRYFLVTNKKGTHQLIVQKRERVKSALLFDNNPTVDDLRRATNYFLMAHNDLLKKKYSSHIVSNFDHYNDQSNWESWMKLSHGRNDKFDLVKYFQKIFTFNSARRGSSLEEENDKQADHEQMPEAQSEAQSSAEQNNDWNRFAKLVGIDPKESISYTDFQTWVERAHNKCMFLSNTLSSAHDVGSSLNKIISWLLIGATFIMWLLLSGLATTQVLVLVASPLLAATFIFGDSCKTLFQGILFIYVIHPFDVGDLCVIGNDMMVVTAIDIWTTTFSEVDNQSSRKVVIYPNIQLANKVILNYKTKFDWSDCLEFNIGDVEKTNLTHKALIQHFKNRVKDRAAAILSSSPALTILRKDDSVKLVIRLKYKAETTKGWTYFENFRVKDRLQAEFYLVMKEIIRTFKNEYGLD